MYEACVEGLEGMHQLFVFYDNSVLHLARKYDDKIFCYEFNKNAKRLEFYDQVIKVNGGISNLCAVPRKCLVTSINEIIIK